MKLSKSFILPFVALALLSCHKGEKDRLLVGQLPGTNGATAVGKLALGLNGDLYRSPQPAGLAPDSFNTQLRITLKQIEITMDGSNWVPLLDSATSVEISDPINDYIKLSTNPVNVPTGEYHGVRITVDSNPIAIGVSSGTSLDPLPRMQAQDTPQSDKGIRSDIALLSSEFALVPFRIESGIDTFLVLKISPSIFGSEWTLWVKAAATRIQPT